LYLLALEGRGIAGLAEIASNPKLPFSPALMKAMALALSKLWTGGGAQKEWSAALEEARQLFALGC
jgi:hypothetical protein